MPEVRISQLSEGQQRLVRLMTWLKFGEIADLVLREGQPEFDPAPMVNRSVKFAASRSYDASSDPVDYIVKRPVVEMLREFERIGTGRVIRLEIQDGLPFRGVFEVQDGDLKNAI